MLGNLGVHFGAYSHNEELNQSLFGLSEIEHEAFQKYYSYFTKRWKVNDKEDVAFKKALSEGPCISSFISKIKESNVNVFVYNSKNAFEIPSSMEESKDQATESNQLLASSLEKQVEVRKVEGPRAVIQFGNPKRVAEFLEDDILNPKKNKDGDEED